MPHFKLHSAYTIWLCYNGKNKNWSIFKKTFTSISELGPFVSRIEVVGEEKLAEHELKITNNKVVCLHLEKLKPNIDCKQKWITTACMRQSLPDEFATFVVQGLDQWIKKLESRKPEHYKANWTMTDYYDKPCDWEEQEKEYNEKWAKYCRHNNAYNIVCGQLKEYYNCVGRGKL